MLFQCAILPVLLFATSAFGQVDPVSELCLGCICEASSNCDRTLGCEGGLCGLFKMTKPYWIDANKPTIPLDSPAADGAFERCSTDSVCAAEAVKNYMAKFAQDCNNDGKIDCFDYAAIHRLGGYGCQGQVDLKFSQIFRACQAQVQSLAPSIDVRGGNSADIFKK
ncbi:lysozyme [Halyomorpha halys]|uniref:lysozyme n=1 Tax=Halyomorpha halys TaxID=286706 RepID=UPI0006D4DCD7|nr:lysozyme [Halyomorpha halys]